MAFREWIGVDFDGTLVESTHKPGSAFVPYMVGRPVILMVNRVKSWLAQGKEVRIVTARAASTNSLAVANKQIIENWCEKMFGQKLTVTSEKDPWMIELWDDLAIQVVPNTGWRIDGKNNEVW